MPYTLTKYAREYGIPFGAPAPPVNPFASWPDEHKPSPEVIAACSGPCGIDQFRTILRMPGHPTRRAAAASLGLHEQTLRHRRPRVGRAAGIRVFQPGTPLTPTPEDTRFLQHAADALRRLDEHEH